MICFHSGSRGLICSFKRFEIVQKHLQAICFHLLNYTYSSFSYFFLTRKNEVIFSILNLFLLHCCLGRQSTQPQEPHLEYEYLKLKAERPHG